jgi:predicted transcriptional regulator
MNSLKINNLTKTYNNHIKALSNISLVSIDFALTPPVTEVDPPRFKARQS